MLEFPNSLHNILHFGKIIHGNFKVLCIKKFEVDNGFEKYTFNPMTTYDAHRSGSTVLVEIPPIKSSDGGIETTFQGYAKLDLYRARKKGNKVFSDYFRIL
jgi:hypothetical protein